LVKVFIFDDHAVFREGIKSILLRNNEIQVVGESSDGSGAVARITNVQPDVILMDVNMPYSGLQATLDILAAMPEMKILILTVSENEADLHKAVKAGARGYLLKGMSIEELVAAVNSMATGAAVFTPAMAEKLLADFRDDSAKNKDDVNLTDRELEVLKLVAGGASNKEIAARLELSEPTIKSHLRSVLGKLHLKNRSQAAVYASQKDWLKDK
jgi:two-component system, NarL family, nitrate/nitrite response regulator NarL